MKELLLKQDRKKRRKNKLKIKFACTGTVVFASKVNLTMFILMKTDFHLQGESCRCSKCRDIQGQTGTDKDKQGQTGTDRDRQGQTWTDKDKQGQTGTDKDKQGKTGTDRDKQGQAGTKRDCPC